MVDRIIFLAAGMGTRMLPITLDTPKPLIRVNGIRIIDTLLDASIAAGIPEIYIVRGYLSAQFDELLEKYPMIKFIENTDFADSNNISSIVYAKDFLGNSFICEADLFLKKPELIDINQEVSNYLAVPTAHTDDWCFQVENNIIRSIHVGGNHCHHMFGLSYWTEKDGKKLGQHAMELYKTKGGKMLYWDEVALKFHQSEYEILVRKCSFDDIMEIDTLEELQAADPTYKYFNGGA